VLRVLPFRTGDNRIDGATMVAVDIDLVRRSHELIEARDNAGAILQAVREPLVVLNPQCRVEMANDAFYAPFGEAPAQIEDKYLWDAGHGIWADGSLRQALRHACANKNRSWGAKSSGSML
jgi:two-component system CheB/CheR fusion protein